MARAIASAKEVTALGSLTMRGEFIVDVALAEPLGAGGVRVCWCGAFVGGSHDDVVR